MKFPKKEIEFLAHLELGETSYAQLSFEPATIQDTWHPISPDVYPEEDWIPWETVVTWVKHCPDAFRTLRAPNGQKVGAVTYLPLHEEICMALITERLHERDVTPAMFMPWESTGLCLYVATISIRPSGSMQVDVRRGRILLQHALRWGLRLTQTWDVRLWSALGTTSEGQRILELCNFPCVYSSDDGVRKGYMLERSALPTSMPLIGRYSRMDTLSLAMPDQD